MRKERRGYKVVTAEMQSLGLRKNPNIMSFTIGEWTRLPKKQVEEGPDDWGGIWVARTAGGANKLKTYMKEKHRTNCWIFVARLETVLYENSYRIKTTGVFLEEEI